MKFFLPKFLFLVFVCAISSLKAQEVKLSMTQLALTNARMVSIATTGSITGNVATQNTTHKKVCVVYIQSAMLKYKTALRLDGKGNFFVTNLQPGNYAIDVVISWCDNCPEGAGDGPGWNHVFTQEGKRYVVVTAGETAVQNFKVEE